MSNSITKAKIKIKEADGSDTTVKEFDVLFNPNEYKVSFTNRVNKDTEIGKKPSSNNGDSTTATESVPAETNQTFTVEFFFDTYEKKTSVKEYTDKFFDAMAINDEKKVIRYCEFIWGDFNFIGIATSMNHTFNMFLSNGVPVRAKVNLTLELYNNKSNEKPQVGALNEVSFDWSKIAADSNIDNPRLLFK